MIASLLMVNPVHSTPLVYNREILTINSTAEVPNPAYQGAVVSNEVASNEATIGENGAKSSGDKSQRKSTKNKTAKIPKTFTQTREHVFYITAENDDAASKNWFINSTNIKGNKGVIYLLDEPALPTISHSPSSVANDILFIGSYGAIKAIAKNISPSELAEPITLEIPVKAILYIEAGMSDKLGIKPFDMVSYSAFPKQPNLEK